MKIHAILVHKAFFISSSWVYRLLIDAKFHHQCRSVLIIIDSHVINAHLIIVGGSLIFLDVISYRLNMPQDPSSLFFPTWGSSYALKFTLFYLEHLLIQPHLYRAIKKLACGYEEKKEKGNPGAFFSQGLFTRLRRRKERSGEKAFFFFSCMSTRSHWTTFGLQISVVVYYTTTTTEYSVRLDLGGDSSFSPDMTLFFVVSPENRRFFHQMFTCFPKKRTKCCRKYRQAKSLSFFEEFWSHSTLIDQMDAWTLVTSKNLLCPGSIFFPWNAESFGVDFTCINNWRQFSWHSHW